MAENKTRQRTANKRGARKGLRRSKTIALKKLSEDERLEVAHMLGDLDLLRPRDRSECRSGERPCPFVSCKYHLYLDVNPHTGSIKLNFPDLEVWELAETCALDVADRGGITLEEVGELLNLTRERIRQVEATGLEKLRDEYDD
ncbi:MAG: DNA-binding protein [Bradymonadaceae bacterium]|nr:DNA-binding protein [Lujinxingiaceae bacterium]